MSGWRYAERDVLARVETLRPGDRIYLPGVHRRGPGRVVASVELYDAAEAVHLGPTFPHAVVSYYTGERARPLGLEPGELGELVQSQLRPLELGERVRCRRAVRDAAA